MTTTQSRLKENIFALGLLQIANYIIPLISIPYLTRVLGAQQYGEVVFTQSLAAYCILLSDYGFSWSATRKISIHRDDFDLVSKTFLANWGAQWLLTTLAVTILSLLIITIPQLKNNAHLYFCGLIFVFGNAMFPIWLLQGLEKLKEVAAIQIISRLATLPLIFITVNNKNDASYAILSIGSGPLIAGIICLSIINKKKLVRFSRFHFTDTLFALKEGASLFFSKIAISSYTMLTPIILAMISGPTALGYFNIADKARVAAQALLGPISQALYPRMSFLYGNDKKSANTLLKKSIIAVCFLSSCASLSLLFFSEYIVLTLGGAEFLEAATILKYLSPVPLIVGLSNIFGIQIMLPKKLNKQFNIILFTAALLSLITIWPLIKTFDANGAAITILITELFVTISMATYLIITKNIFSKD